MDHMQIGNNCNCRKLLFKEAPMLDDVNLFGFFLKHLLAMLDDELTVRNSFFLRDN